MDMGELFRSFSFVVFKQISYNGMGILSKGSIFWSQNGFCQEAYAQLFIKFSQLLLLRFPHLHYASFWSLIKPANCK